MCLVLLVLVNLLLGPEVTAGNPKASGSMEGKLQAPMLELLPIKSNLIVLMTEMRKRITIV